MKKELPGSIFVGKRDKKIIIYLNRERKYTGLTDTPANRKIAEKMLLKMYLENNGIAQKKSPRSLYSTYQEFLDIHCKSLSIKTSKNYKLAFNKIVLENTALTTEHLKQHVHNFIRRYNGSDATFNIYLRAFQVFINYCLKNEYISNFPAYSNYKRPNSEKEIKVFTETEINTILDFLEHTDKEFAILINLLVSTGMRIKEALTLDLSQIRPDRILIPNKINKNKPETVYISENILQQLSTLGNPKIFRWKDTSYSRINRTFRRTLIDLGIPDDRSFHELRKTYLKRLIDAGTPVEIAQKLMRHKNINVTINFYAYIQDTDLKSYQAKIQK